MLLTGRSKPTRGNKHPDVSRQAHPFFSISKKNRQNPKPKYAVEHRRSSVLTQDLNKMKEIQRNTMPNFKIQSEDDHQSETEEEQMSEA